MASSKTLDNSDIGKHTGEIDINQFIHVPSRVSHLFLSMNGTILISAFCMFLLLYLMIWLCKDLIDYTSFTGIIVLLL